MIRQTSVPPAILLAATALFAAPAQGAPRLDGAIGDHAVLQRDQPIRLRGTAAPGETVMIGLAGRSVTAKADRNGRFEAQMPALPAGGPYDLTIAAPSGAGMIRDLLVGDVFLCSGQSNMEMPVDAAQQWIADARPPVDDKLRLVTIEKIPSNTPLSTFAQTPAWVVAGPETARKFSAACFYMVQALRRTQPDVPMGAIASDWGGSRISAWMDAAGLRRAGMGAEADLLALYARDPAAAQARASTVWENWWRRKSGDAPGREPWQPNAALDWKPVPRIANFETWGVPELDDYNGMIWYSREIDLTPEQARGAATLAIGAVDDADRTWVNGVGVGGSSLAGQPRLYALPAGTLKAGRNIVTVNDDDVYALGGMTGPVEQMALTLADGTRIPLGTGWRYAVARKVEGDAPRVPWDDINGAGTLYNGMIAPLGPIGLAGIAWYQGESDTGLPGYDARLAAMTAAWRAQFGRADLPLAVVQLAGYGKPATSPGESGWATVRDDQRRMTARDGHAGVAVAIDLGDPLDIHPGEKHEVGQRLARVMRSLAYRSPEPMGPAIGAAERTADGGVRLRIDGATGALHTRSSSQAIGFELCDAAPGTCRYASAVAEGATVRLAGDGKPVTRVRYAWADSPVVNLFDDAPLPLGPFEVALP